MNGVKIQQGGLGADEIVSTPPLRGAGIVMRFFSCASVEIWAAVQACSSATVMVKISVSSPSLA